MDSADDDHPVLTSDVFDGVDDLSAGRAIQAASWFIEEEDTGSRNQGTPDGYSSALSSRDTSLNRSSDPVTADFGKAKARDSTTYTVVYRRLRGTGRESLDAISSRFSRFSGDTHESRAAKRIVSATDNTPMSASFCSTYEEISRILKNSLPLYVILTNFV